mgnify:CR=1 FL=1
MQVRPRRWRQHLAGAAVHRRAASDASADLGLPLPVHVDDERFLGTAHLHLLRRQVPRLSGAETVDRHNGGLRMEPGAGHVGADTSTRPHRLLHRPEILHRRHLRRRHQGIKQWPGCN